MILALQEILFEVACKRGYHSGHEISQMTAPEGHSDVTLIFWSKLNRFRMTVLDHIAVKLFLCFNRVKYTGNFDVIVSIKEF